MIAKGNNKKKAGSGHHRFVEAKRPEMQKVSVLLKMSLKIRLLGHSRASLRGLCFAGLVSGSFTWGGEGKGGGGFKTSLRDGWERKAL